MDCVVIRALMSCAFYLSVCRCDLMYRDRTVLKCGCSILFCNVLLCSTGIYCIESFLSVTHVCSRTLLCSERLSKSILSTPLHSTSLFYLLLRYATLHYIILHCFIIYCAILCCAVLCCQQ